MGDLEFEQLSPIEDENAELRTRLVRANDEQILNSTAHKARTV